MAAGTGFFSIFAFIAYLGASVAQRRDVDASLASQCCDIY
jgi:hypothetical protein